MTFVLFEFYLNNGAIYYLNIYLYKMFQNYQIISSGTSFSSKEMSICQRNSCASY